MTKSFFARPDTGKEAVVLFGEDKTGPVPPVADVAMRLNPVVFTGPNGAVTVAEAVGAVLNAAHQRLAAQIGVEAGAVSNGALVAEAVTDILRDAEDKPAPEVFLITGPGGAVWAAVSSYENAIDWLAGFNLYAGSANYFMTTHGLSKEDAVAATLASAAVETCMIERHGTSPRPGFDSARTSVDMVEKGEEVLRRLDEEDEEDNDGPETAGEGPRL